MPLTDLCDRHRDSPASVDAVAKGIASGQTESGCWPSTFAIIVLISIGAHDPIIAAGDGALG
jgi:hypothetical protein